MKTKYTFAAALSIFATLFACEDLQKVTPTPNTTSPGLTANFTFANALVDSVSLDFYVNNVKLNTSARDSAQKGYTTVAITSNGTFTNTNIQVDGTSGTIGGILGSSNLVYRSSSTSTSGFTATNGLNYSIFVIDSLTRPAPLRKLNAGNFGDTTFYNYATGQYISTVDRKGLTAAQKAKLISIGTVPLGCTDPGGPRFYITQDVFPTFPGGNTTQSAIRFVNLVPNSYGVGAAPNSPSYPATTQQLWVRLTPATGTKIQIGSGSTYIQAGSIASRFASGSTFTLQTTAPGGVAAAYNVEIATNSAYTGSYIIPNVTLSFLPNKIYTVYVSGLWGNPKGKTLKVGVIKHN